MILESAGELLLLPEYALTGSLILEKEVDLGLWIEAIKMAIGELRIPEGKELLLNYIIKLEGNMYNCSQLFPSEKRQCKLHPDSIELENGLIPGMVEEVFEHNDKNYKVIICTDMRYIDSFNLIDVKFLVFVYHFSEYSLERVLTDLKQISKKYNIPILVSSILSDKNVGYSSYIYKDTVISLPKIEGVLEIEF
ncbi:carbon-nitrogen hydrolase family protein [Vallitalea okinawensis]|uniref:hypothetical protein n=1 Tax=Vallitalea okinawensis TaxID=2078660 RepID=UPI000CFB4F44|nr:hypothetical protein [Vallitalea okinawensis]